MTRSRRDFVRMGGVATAYAALARPSRLLAADPAVGLIFPPLN
jgi:hypothetical protein